MTLSEYEGILGYYMLWMRCYRLSFSEIDDMPLETLMDLMIVDAKINGEPPQYVDEYFR